MAIPVSSYKKVKTPFYSISIGDSYGKSMTQLPMELMKLCKKVEIMETFEFAGFHTINLTFIEGSREPQLNVPGYALSDNKITGGLSNTPGMITDLKFKGHVAVSDNKEVGIFGRLSDLRGFIETKELLDGKIVIKRSPKAAAPKYMFQERNQVKVTWGYKEDPGTVRSMRGYIILVQSNFDNDGPVETVVTCQSSDAFLDQVSIYGKGNVFAKTIKTGTSGFLVDFEDRNTEELIKEIAQKLGANILISKDLPAPVLNKSYAKVHIVGESYHQFFKRLARLHNCYYRVLPDPQTGIDTILFIKQDDFEAKPIVDNPYIFYYKSPQSIVKSVNIRSDFGIIGGVVETGIDQQGEIITQPADSGKEYMSFVQSKSQNKTATVKEQMMNVNPASTNPVRVAKNAVDNLGGGISTGKVELSPIDNGRSNYIENSKRRAEENARGIVLEMTTIGFTRLTPGLMVLRGIGERYSGSYKIMTVNHVLDSSGYSCKAIATTYAIRNGVDVPEAKKVTEQEVISGLVDIVSEAITSDQNLRQKYNNFIFK